MYWAHRSKTMKSNKLSQVLHILCNKKNFLLAKCSHSIPPDNVSLTFSKIFLPDITTLLYFILGSIINILPIS